MDAPFLPEITDGSPVAAKMAGGLYGARGTPLKRPRKEQEVQCFTWDFTLNATDDDEIPDVAGVCKDLRRLAKRWEFSLERAPTTGRRHYQGKVSLRKKERHSAAIAAACGGTHLQRCTWTLTTSINAKVFTYTDKLQTHLEGPWRDTDAQDISADLKDLKGWVNDPWMDYIINTEMGPRAIGWLYDPKGSLKKSFFATAIGAKGIGIVVPHFGDASKMTSFVAHRAKLGLYVVNIPRTGGGKKMIAETNGFLERIKDGHLSDWKYQGTYTFIDRPRVWVLSNELPVTEGLVNARWHITMVDPATDKMVKYDPKHVARITAVWERRQAMNIFKPIEIDEYVPDPADDYLDEPPAKKQRVEELVFPPIL